MFPFSDRIYKILKWLAMAVLPALAALVLTLGQIWGLPCAEPIALTVTAVNAFFGALIGVSASTYNKTKNQS
jgi:hypothetical protein